MRRYQEIRDTTAALAAPLCAEDTCIQSMPDVSPTKWHLAHVTWFFETFVLRPYSPGYRSFDERFDRLFNSYYETVGRMHPRAERGLLSRPTLAEVLEYRAYVDAAVGALSLGESGGELRARIELGLQHEQQHQELLLMDVKHVLGMNPLRPAYRSDLPLAEAGSAALGWCDFEGGLLEFGAAAGEGFVFDNETPRHRVYIAPFALASRPVTNGEWLEFVADGGYRRAELWLADGWALVQSGELRAPLYWQPAAGPGGLPDAEYTLGGLRSIDRAAPVVHVSYYEAEAFACWAGARLPTEFEWEHAAAGREREGNFVEDGLLQPAAAPARLGRPAQLFGDVWEWTRSAYLPYPGFRPLPGSLGEYNGKFMCRQQVLRGGACVTPRAHVRASYRNFFHPQQRWAFAGLRLARDAG